MQGYGNSKHGEATKQARHSTRKYFAVFGFLSVVMMSLAIGANLLFSGVEVQAINVIRDGQGNTEFTQRATQQDISQDNTIQNIINILLFVLGTAAVIAIIVAGITYATANGDASKTKQAKDTIMYAVIGLVVALLAWAIVSFVLKQF